MIPKKIYLNYVNEEDENKTWSETPVDVSDCEMLNREYTDLSQIWHDASEEPKRTPILCQNERGNVWVQYHLRDYINAWREFKEYEDVARWAYLSDLLPKGGEE